MIPPSGGGGISFEFFFGLPEVLVEVGQSAVLGCPSSPLFAVEGEEAIVFDDGDAGPNSISMGVGGDQGDLMHSRLSASMSSSISP